MPEILVDVDDRLLTAAVEQLGTATPEDTIQAALRAAAGRTAPDQLSELTSPEEDVTDIADADAAMAEPGESTTLEQAEAELDQLDAPTPNLPESRRTASERLISELKAGMLADLADPEIMGQAQR